MDLTMMTITVMVYMLFGLNKYSEGMTHPRVKMYGPKVTIVEHRQMEPTVEEVKSFAKTEQLPNEPNCVELRVMWRLSQRLRQAMQSSNNIPGNDDPFKYNLYEDYAKPRYANRQRSLMMGQSMADRYQLYAEMRPFDKVARMASLEWKQAQERAGRKPNLFRLGFPMSKIPGTAMRLTAKNRFQELRELIRKEKIKHYRNGGRNNVAADDSIPVMPLTDISPESTDNKRPGYETLMTRPRHFSYGQYMNASSNDMENKLTTASPPQIVVTE
ncbi:uncharacterized protein LOC126844204 isoform X2 [Adelges cooleyi]|uniref:uncharacterized protein LOC126844204 isoform X2 n=1 Tax=Adelges cooleyi TaxID=133065 RepID=UPI002180126B|nr:uncharacterized protein LOC126844204 isoform X2 [Adelges cooleyi]